MKRMQVLFGNRRMMVLLTLAILVLAAAALIASSASFTAQSSNVSNVFTAGNLTLTENQVLNFSAAKLMPGQSLQGTANLTVVSDGGTSRLFLQRTDLTGNAAFAGRLTLTVNDGASDVYTGTLDAADLAAGYRIANVPSNAPAGTVYNYTFTVRFLNGDDGTFANAGADDGYKNATATASYQFTAVSD